MNDLYLLDCTLRDGGYVNNWEFGEECIKEFPRKLCEANIDIIELGFIRNEKANTNRSVYTSVHDLNRFDRNIEGKRALYSAMIEGSEKETTFPVEKLGTPQQTGIDLIRICTWKRLMQEHMDYCRAVSNLGFGVSIQPTAIDQYNDEEFITLCQSANNVRPFAFYLVDTWGTQSAKQISHYAEMANRWLNKGIKLGYHGHNNKMQALSCVDAILSLKLDRDICIDASVMGMGRGPGNLQTEIAMSFLNDSCQKKYNLDAVIEMYSKYVKKIYDVNPWGYSVYHYVSAEKALPQDFASYFKEHDYSIEAFITFIASLTASEKIVFKRQFVEERLSALGITKRN